MKNLQNKLYNGRREWSPLEFDVLSIEWLDVSTDLAELFNASKNNILTVKQLKKYEMDTPE